MRSVSEQLIPTPALVRAVLDCRFRANPSYRLVAQADLPLQEQLALSGLSEDPNHFGLLLPAREALGVLAIDNATARLFTDLQQPDHLPARVRDNSEPQTNDRVVKLVLDGVLEIERDGKFLSGPRAHSVILARPSTYAAPRDPIAQLSRDALRLAQVLPIDEPQPLARWIYAFNTLPASPRTVARIGTPEAVANATGRAVGDPVRRALEKDYDHGTVGGWHSWQARDRQLKYSSPAGTSGAYKLYISPHPSVFASAFHAAVDAIVELRPTSFKTGRTLFGLLRPDKLMIYFDELPELERFVRRVRTDLEGCVPHGVPFTAALDDTGLLSWGVDPPRMTAIQGWRGSASWRSWLTARLARALLTSRVSGLGEDPNIVDDTLEPWVCALDRISVEGIDPETWTPVSNLWLSGDRGGPADSRGSAA